MTPPTAALPIAHCRFCGSDCYVEVRPNGEHTNYQVICDDVPSDCGYKGPTRIYKNIAVLLHNEAMCAPAVQATADEAIKAAAREIVEHMSLCDASFVSLSAWTGAKHEQVLANIMRQHIRKAVSPKAAAENTKENDNGR